MNGNSNLLITIQMFNSYIKCSYGLQKRDRTRQTLPGAILHILSSKLQFDFFVVVFFPHGTPVLRSCTHASLGYLINNAPCHKPSVLNSVQFVDKCCCSDFPNWTFDRHIHKQKCNTSASDSSPQLKEGVRETDRQREREI